MPVVPIPNCVTVELIYVQETTRLENIYRVTNGAPATLAQLQALWVIFRDWENVTAKLLRRNNASLVLIKLTANDAAGAPVYEAPVIPAIVGSINSAGVVPPFVTLAVKHTTGLAGRNYRGRTYWIGVSPSGGGNDLASQPVVDGIVNAYNTMRASLLTAGWTLVVGSLYSGVVIVNGRRRAVPRVTGIITPITASSAERGWDTNRHRKLPYQV